MALNLERKKAIVSQVNKVANSAISLVAADYRGLTSSEMTLLREKAREMNVQTLVVRNTLAKRAFNDTSFECVTEHLTGPIILFFSQNEPGSAARLVRDFSKSCENLEVKVLSLSANAYGKEKLEFMASLPTRDEALSRLLATMQAPIAKFVRTLAEPHAKLVRVFAAVRDQKKANG